MPRREWDWTEITSKDKEAHKKAADVVTKLTNQVCELITADMDDAGWASGSKPVRSIVQIGLFVFGREAALAMRAGGTKDRRDELRKAADGVLSADLRSHPSPDKRWVPGNYSEIGAAHGKGHITQFGHTECTVAGVSHATVRNLLTQANLQLLALGLVNGHWIGNMRAGGMASPDINEAIEKVFRRTLGYLPTIFEKLEEIEKIFEAAGLGATATTTATATATTEKDMTATAEATTAAAAPMSAAATAATKALDTGVFKRVDASVKALIDANMKAVGLPTVDEIGAAIAELSDKAAKSESGIKISLGKAMHYEAPKGGKLPNGTAKTENAAKLFGLTGAAAKPFDFDVPCYEWDAPHPFVPEIDESYQFQPQMLLSLLMALITNQRTWMYGDTGCGKTTAVEQMCARLNYPVVRVNFDSEITRMDLIGAKDIVVASGHPVTVFTEGVLPMAMQMPCVFLADELDFIRADVAYVFQRALEGKGLTIPEDGGRTIVPHAGFRIIATANTQGNGDETGRYQGAKPQSAAFLDRFTVWIKCDYMSLSDVRKLLEKRYPKLGKVAETLAKYAQEHWVAFRNGEVLTPLSPRGLLSCAMTYTIYRPLMDEKKALEEAIQLTFLQRASKEDAQTIKGLLSRVMR